MSGREFTPDEILAGKAYADAMVRKFDRLTQIITNWATATREEREFFYAWCNGTEEKS